MRSCQELGFCQTRTPRCPDCVISPAEERHRCEVRFVLRMRDESGVQATKDRIDSLEPLRGKDAAKKLRDDATAQWKAGNRGLAGDWRQV